MTRPTDSLPTIALTALGAALAALALAPLAMPSTYDWISNSISESGAQQLPGAWVARSGFLLFGIGVLLTALLQRVAWGALATWLLAAFGVLMMSCAAFSTRQWMPDAPFDPTEAALHSAAATIMGFCYGFGVLFATLHDRGMSVPQRVFSMVAVVSSIVLPLGVGLAPHVGGVLQRLMFAIAFAWFIIEAARSRTSSD